MVAGIGLLGGLCVLGFTLYAFATAESLDPGDVGFGLAVAVLFWSVVLILACVAGLRWALSERA